MAKAVGDGKHCFAWPGEKHMTFQAWWDANSFDCREGWNTRILWGKLGYSIFAAAVVACMHACMQQLT
jgi:hypothetical protein